MFKRSQPIEVPATSLSPQRARAYYKRCILTSVSALSLTLSFGHASFAQTEKSEAIIDEVVVTGSHIVRDGYEAPSPLTVVSIEEIESGAREDLAAYIGLMPSTVANYSPTATGITTNTGQTGVNSVNLRSLGTMRTLVLMDGRRGVATAGDGTIDISELPQELVSRVDVVTGGGSAAYGSDAVAGVVNFILDKTYTGVKGSIEGGVTSRGDNRNWKINLTGGTAFANDRGHFLISGSVAHRDGILSYQDREWNTRGYSLFQNPAWNATTNPSVPQHLMLPQTAVWALSTGGVITNTALKGTEFGPGGVPFQFNFGPLVAGNVTQGGDWRTRVPIRSATIDPRSKRQSLFTRLSYDVTDNLNVYTEVSWADSFSLNRNAAQNYVGNLTIKSDNAFIPASTRARLTALGLTQFNMGYSAIYNTAPGPSPEYGQGHNHRRLNRYSIGATGNFDAFNTNWKWDVYAHTGATRVSLTYYNASNTANFNRAIDAVVSPTTGAIICRSTLTAPTNGCVPYNIMGVNVNSQAAINYVAGTTHLNQKFTQKNLVAGITGEPFSTWAGPVSVAAGIEWRREGASGVANALSAAFGASTANFQPTTGQQSVTEGYLETVIPLAKDQSWAKSLDLNAALRLTEYTLSGFGHSYKVGATYQPIDDLRFRATRSHDFRAPNLGELFAGGATSMGILNDPFNNNATITTTQTIIGNPNLVPEKANTTQVGVVFQPTFLPGFSASADYWNLKITNAISSITNVQTLANCFAGLQVFCDSFVRTPLNLNFRLYPFNLASQSRNGLDLEAGYKFALADISESWGGNLELRVLATKHFHARVDPGIVGNPILDFVGGFDAPATGNTLFGVPEWIYTTTLTYDNDPIRVTLTGHGFNGGKMDNRYTECTSGCPASTPNNPTINRNYMPAAFYLDASVNYKMTDVVSVFFAVQNMMDLEPAHYFNAVNANSPTYSPVNHVFYDVIGRAFRAGVRFKL